MKTKPKESPKTSENTCYYNTKESFTMRTDIDCYMKWILTHMDSKLQIPPEDLQDAIIPGKYTFSVSGVSKCLGFPLTTTQSRFKVLEKIDIIRNIGTANTTHGTIVIWDVNREKFKKVMNGNITIPKTAAKVPHIRKEGSTPPVEGSTPPVLPTTPPVGGSTPPVTSNKIEYPNSSIQKQYSNGPGLFLITGSVQEPNNHTTSTASGSVGPLEQKKTPNGKSQSGQNMAGKGSDGLQEFDAMFPPEPITNNKPGDEPDKNPNPSMAPDSKPDKDTNSITVPGPGPDSEELKESIRNAPDPTLVKWKMHQMGRI